MFQKLTFTDNGHLTRGLVVSRVKTPPGTVRPHAGETGWMIPVLVCRNLVDKYSILYQEDSRWTEPGQELVSLLEAGPSQTQLHDIMKAAREPAVSCCAASNHSQMFC